MALRGISRNSIEFQGIPKESVGIPKDRRGVPWDRDGALWRTLGNATDSLGIPAVWLVSLADSSLYETGESIGFSD